MIFVLMKEATFKEAAASKEMIYAIYNFAVDYNIIEDCQETSKTENCNVAEDRNFTRDVTVSKISNVSQDNRPAYVPAYAVVFLHLTPSPLAVVDLVTLSVWGANMRASPS